MRITFLGTNGWYSTQTGNTPCVLIDSKDAYIVLDMGEGMYKLDRYIKDDRKHIYVFLSHFHLDHIYGLHILDKFHFKQGMTIFGKKGWKDVAKLLINYPFTNKIERMATKIAIEEISEGKHDKPLEFECALLPHADPSMGYRFHIEDKTITYCTDTGCSDDALRLAKGADVFISECAKLTGQPIEPHWPHMTPELAAQEAKDAGAKKLVLMHFGAEAYETIESRKAAESVAKKVFKNTVAAEDGMQLEL